MKDNYEDIINLPHHVSPKRRHMSLYDRAAQFAPFAALTGYDDAINETARFTDNLIEMDDNARTILDNKIAEIMGIDSPSVTITHFVPDSLKDGGQYTSSSGIIKKIDDYKKTIIMQDGLIISIQNILDIEIHSTNQ